MMNYRHNSRRIPGRRSLGTGLQIGMIASVSILVTILLLWNTSDLQAVLVSNTDAYVQDVSFQLTNDISAWIQGDETVLLQLADSVSGMPDDMATQRFLQQKSDVLGFDSLAVVDKYGRTVPQNASISGQGAQAAFAGETAVSADEQQRLLFSVPVYVDGEIEKVLSGVRGKENMQSLIQPKSFGGKGLTCIIDSGGKVVVSPTDLKPFLELDDIFKAGTGAENPVIEMQGRIGNMESGVFHFTAADDSRLVLAYHPLGISDWILLTIVPADLILGEANRYIVRMFMIVGGIVLVFALFLFTILRFSRKNRRWLEKAAFTDPVTGGMNNTAFLMEGQKLANGARPGTYTVVMLNVQGFRIINESFGIKAGDDVFRHIYRILGRHIRKEELLARGEADHFFLCIKEHMQDAIQSRLDVAVADINAYTRTSEETYYLSIIQGACPVEAPDADMAIVQDRARTACRTQKEKGACTFYNAAFTQALQTQQELNSLFESSLENRDFQVYLQPKVRLADGKISGAEALVRWSHPQRGTIFPSEFIPVFEKNGNITRLDLYMLETVCRLLRRWMDEGKNLIPVSVNLSRAHFRKPDFLLALAEIKEHYQIPDGILELELTESLFFETPQFALVQKSIQDMHRYGFLCSLDDFGVGYSSLALLKEFDVDTIKLDKQFFADITNTKAQYIIESFMDLADKLKLHVVAEGIETEDQIDFLRRMHCELVQGYFFSKPLPVPEFEQWAAKHSHALRATVAARK